MNLKSLSKEQIVSNLESLIQEERRIGVEILYHLREVERQMIFAEYAYGSLHEFCVRHLKYSEGAAHRRISAMRLMKVIPEVAQAIQTGEMTLTTASMAQDFFRREELTIEEKRELLTEMAGKSKRECEQVLAAISPEAARPDRERMISETETEIRFVADEALMQKLQKIRALLAHKSADPSYAELLNEMADLVLQKLDPEQQRSRRTSPARSAEEKAYIPAALVREVWKRYHGRCSFIEPKTGRRCGSRHALQVDHIIAYAMGGKTSLENLRLVCQAHNQYLALLTFGHAKIAQYLPRLR